MPEQPPPKRPYRDTVLFHLALAGVIVGVAFVTGGSVVRAAAFAAAFFVLIERLGIVPERSEAARPG